MLSFLKYSCFIHLFVVDTPTNKFRFALNYTFLSNFYSSYINFITLSSEYDYVVSITDMFLAAGFAEREVWDMFGIFFLDHTNMQRLIIDYGFKGYPLRKDFPLSGYLELFYSDKFSRILYEKIEFVQSFRETEFEKL